MRNLFLVLCLMCVVPNVSYAVNGGEGENTGCNGQGNDNSPCGEGNTPEVGDGGVTVNVEEVEVDVRSNSVSSAQAGVATNTVSINQEATDLSRSVGHPGTVLAGVCSNGGAGGFPGGSVAFGKSDPFCKYMALSTAAFAAGDNRPDGLGWYYMNKAYDTVERQTMVSRFLDWIPLVGSLL